MGLSAHQAPVRGASDDWLTPPEIIKDLGPFDLDPCAGTDQPWRTATIQWDADMDGLRQNWGDLRVFRGHKPFVWCNPPFGPEAERWLERMGLHGHGLALVPARTETRWFIRTVWEMADAVLFLHSRPHFHYPDGKRAPFNSGAPICLVGYGSVAAERLKGSSLRGTYVTDWRNP